jgi:hypothetical protein
MPVESSTSDQGRSAAPRSQRSRRVTFSASGGDQPPNKRNSNNKRIGGCVESGRAAKKKQLKQIPYLQPSGKALGDLCDHVCDVLPGRRNIGN